MKSHPHNKVPAEISAAYQEQWATEAEALRERLVFICTDLAPSRGVYEYLEKRTSIAASKWKNVFLRRQMPTIEMLIAMCSYRSEFALWLMTGSLKSHNPLAPEPEEPSPEHWANFTAHRSWKKQETKTVVAKES